MLQSMRSQRVGHNLATEQQLNNNNINLIWETLKTLLSDYNGRKFNPGNNREETEHKILKKGFVPVVDLQVMLQKL